jgi:hypothetical protein
MLVNAFPERPAAPVGPAALAPVRFTGRSPKRSGQRWSQRGLTAALHLRAMHESNRFDAFWSFFSRRYRATNIVPLGLDNSHRARVD